MNGISENDVHSDDCLKLCILNFGKWSKEKEFIKILDSTSIKYKSISKQNHCTYGFLTFHNEEDRNKALEILPSLTFRGKNIEISMARPKKSLKPLKRPLNRSNNDDITQDDKENCENSIETIPLNNKKIKMTSSIDTLTVENAVTPWNLIPYQEQLRRKENDMRRVLVRFVRCLRKEYMKKIKNNNKVNKKIINKNKNDNIKVDSRPNEVKIPKWLDTDGYFYLIKNDNKMYKKDLNMVSKDRPSDWQFVCDAENVKYILSFGGELIGVKSNDIQKESGSFIYRWIPNTEGQNWQQYGVGPEKKDIISLTSWKSLLFCSTSCGEIMLMKTAIKGLVNKWSSFYMIRKTCHIIVHNGWLYVYIDGEHYPKKIELSKYFDEQDVVTETTFDNNKVIFESCNELNILKIPKDTTVVDIVSHNGSIFIATPENNIYSSFYNIGNSNNRPLHDGRNEEPSVIETLHGPDAIVSISTHKGLCCPMEPIIPSPETTGYRNKCEFSIGYNEHGIKTVGFRLGLYRDGVVTVNQPDGCSNVSDNMKLICELLQDYLRSKSLYDVYNVENKNGTYRSLLVRESKITNQIMIMIQVKPPLMKSDNDKANWNNEKQNVLSIFKEISRFSLTSFFFQEYSGVSAPSNDHPVDCIWGQEYIEENLLGLQFRISPQAFFQVNTKAAEKLYSLVINKIKSNSNNTILFDICCGTGTIGICATKTSDNISEVIGIDICKTAIRDAKKNAEQNNVSDKSITFLDSKAEDVLKETIVNKKFYASDQPFDNIVAVVDPPRCGLHHKVLSAVRDFSLLKKIVYISCNPAVSLINDSAKLCGPKSKTLSGDPFYPTSATPVDLFPSTDHCEMVVVFER